MPFDGNGTFVRTNGVYNGAAVWANDQLAGVNIVVGRHDTHDQDIASGLNSCLLKDGTNSPTANLPMATFEHTGVGSPSDRGNYARVDSLQDQILFYPGQSGHEADDIHTTNSAGISLFTFTAGAPFYITPNSDITSASVTFTVVNSGTSETTPSVDILKGDGTVSLELGDLLEDRFAQLVFDPTTSNKMILLDKNKLLNTYEIADDAIIETKIGDLSDNIVFDTAGKGVDYTVTTGITPAGNTAGAATAITALINQVDFSPDAANEGIILPAASAYIGMTITLVCLVDPTHQLAIYPASGEGFVGKAVDAALFAIGDPGDGGIATLTFVGLQTGGGNNWGYIYRTTDTTHNF